MGYCSRCERQTPYAELRRVKTNSEIQMLCGNCRTKVCDHDYPQMDETPHGEPMCPNCGKIMRETKKSGQTTLGGFEA